PLARARSVPARRRRPRGRPTQPRPPLERSARTVSAVRGDTPPSLSSSPSPFKGEGRGGGVVSTISEAVQGPDRVTVPGAPPPSPSPPRGEGAEPAEERAWAVPSGGCPSPSLSPSMREGTTP